MKASGRRSVLPVSRTAGWAEHVKKCVASRSVRSTPNNPAQRCSDYRDGFRSGDVFLCEIVRRNLSANSVHF